MMGAMLPRWVRTPPPPSLVVAEPTAPIARERALAELGDGDFDLLVIGAGIIGSRIALDAAAGGLRVALLDAADLGGATSSSSSKLVHGGLRYLATGDVRRVREAHHERRALVHRIAPHLVRPLPFLLPAYRGGPHRAPTLAAGLLLYASLSAFRDSHMRLLTPQRARRLVPALRLDDCIGAGMYLDAQTHDHRLCLATARGAADAGAVVVNYARVVELTPARGRIGGAVVVAEGSPDPIVVRATAVVNAAGPWVDAVRRLEDPRAAPVARLSKGVHLLLARPEPWGAAVVAPVDRYRVTFAIPWEGLLLLGTTDTPYHGDPGQVEVSRTDVEGVLAEAAGALEAAWLGPERVRSCFAGLRVLPRSPDDPSRTPRERLLRRGPLGMVSVAGGKLTTHRRIAHEVLGLLHHAGDLPAVPISEQPLPGAAHATERALATVVERIGERFPELAADSCRHLAHLYGSAVHPLLAEARRLPQGLTRIHPDGPDIWAQVTHAVRQEWALHPADVVRRRTTLAARGLDSPELVEEVARVMATAVGAAVGAAPGWTDPP